MVRGRMDFLEMAMRFWMMGVVVVAAGMIGQAARGADLPVGHLTLDPPLMQTDEARVGRMIQPVTAGQIRRWVYGDNVRYVAGPVVVVPHHRNNLEWLSRESAMWTPASRAPAEMALTRPGF